MTLNDNKSSVIVQGRADVWEWFTDNNGVVRAGIGFDDKSWSMVYRKSEDEKFRKLGKARYDDENAGYDLLRLAAGTDEGYILNNKATGRYALYKFNFATKQLGDLILGTDTNDITDYALSEDGKTLKAAWYTTDHDRIVWYDDKLKQHQSEIDAAVSGNENWIGSRSRDDQTMIVWTGASNNPGSYYVYTLSDGRMHLLARMNERVKPAELAPATYTHYHARDGLDVPAYLTLPLGRAPKNLPLIILPHGGPFSVRDSMDYDPDVQLLANRGYAVLQPNFRGSDSYGKDFYEKGFGEWGRKMQDDLDDGMDWLVKNGVADPKRVCIVGASYGGYAAMWGATRNPDRYRCAASYAGISDMGKMLKYDNTYWISKKYRKDWRTKVQGKIDFDLKSVSPIFNVDKMQVPLLIVHGDADQNVPYKQSKSYADALQKAGKVVEFYTHKDEGHGFSSSENAKDWYDRLDTFLAKYNPADPAAAAKP